MVAEEFIFVVGLPPTWNVDTCRVGYSSNHILVPTSQNNLIGTCCCPGDYLINDSPNYRGSAKYVCTMYVTHSLMLWWMLATCHGWVLTACITTVFMNTVLSRVMLTSYCRLSGTVLKLSLHHFMSPPSLCGPVHSHWNITWTPHFMYFAPHDIVWH